MFCRKCGTENTEGSKFCFCCGEILSGENHMPKMEVNINPTVHCPRCKSENVQLITKTNVQGGGYGWCRGCLGIAIFGPLGLLCGMCGNKVTSTNSTVFSCMECGFEFLRIEDMISKKEGEAWIRRAAGVIVLILAVIVAIVSFSDGEFIQGLGVLVFGVILAVGLGIASYEEAQEQCEDVKKNGYDSSCYLKERKIY